MNPLQPRTVTHDQVTYHVVRLYSSGVGPQYACTRKADETKVDDPTVPAKTLLLTEEFVTKHPEHFPLYQACARRFDDALTFAKFIGSSSFWQSKVPPDGIGNPDAD
jgi:hypothetical protein